MKEFVINSFLTLRLEYGRTDIYVKSELFGQCKSILLKILIEDTERFEEIESIDEAADIMGWARKEQVEIQYEDYPNEFFNLEIVAIDPKGEKKKSLEYFLKQGMSIDEFNFSYEEEKAGIEYDIDPKKEFLGNCSNLQAWYEHNYDTRLLHSNLAFPLLKKLADFRDPLAKRVFKEEIVKRLESGYPSVVTYIIEEDYLEYLNHREFDHLIKNKFHSSLKKLSERCSDLFMRSVIKASEVLKGPHKFYSDLLEFIDKLHDDHKYHALYSIVRAINDRNLLDEYLPDIDIRFRIYSKNLNKLPKKKNIIYAWVSFYEVAEIIEWKKEYIQLLIKSIYCMKECDSSTSVLWLLRVAKMKDWLEDFFLTFLDFIGILYKSKNAFIILDAYNAFSYLIDATKWTDLINEHNSQVKAMFLLLMNRVDRLCNYDKRCYSKFIQSIKGTELEAEEAFQKWIELKKVQTN